MALRLTAHDHAVLTEALAQAMRRESGRQRDRAAVRQDALRRQWRESRRPLGEAPGARQELDLRD